MSTKNALLCLYQNPAAFDDRKTAATSPLLPIHSTLKLWGDAYLRCRDEKDLEERVAAAAARREESFVVVEGVRPALLGRLAAVTPHPRVTLVTSEGMGLGPAQVEASRGVDHVLSLSQDQIATRALLSCVKKWTTRDLFGVEKYLAFGTPVHAFTVGGSAERAWFVDTLIDFVSGLEGVIPSGAQDFARMAGEALDEMLMNAIWDANPAHAKSPRDRAVTLGAHEEVRVEWGVDGHVLAVGVTDPFGTMETSSLQDYRYEVLGVTRPDTVRVDTEGPGAGIGLHMVVRRCSGLVINMNPGVSTEFIALFDITRSPRYLSNGPKAFHFFSL